MTKIKSFGDMTLQEIEKFEKDTNSIVLIHENDIYTNFQLTQVALTFDDGEEFVSYHGMRIVIERTEIDIALLLEPIQIQNLKNTFVIHKQKQLT